MTNYIWRLANSQGSGAYSCIWGVISEQDISYGTTHHPCPYDEGYDPPINSRLFGFKDVIHARRWWCSLPDLIQFEDDWDARLVAYHVDDCYDVVHLSTQTIFHPKDKSKFVALPASWLHIKRVAELETLVNTAYEANSFGGVSDCP